MVADVIQGVEAVAWTCFLLGILVLITGVWIGLRTPVTDEHAVDEVGVARAKLAEAAGEVEKARLEIVQLARDNLTAGGPDASPAATAAHSAAQATQEAKSAVEQIQGTIAALPENVRFPGFLVLVGAALMSVATVQFGGISLF
jgi:hypothetical protein